MSIALIMAGGFGKRLWPESTLNHPKQFLFLQNKKSFLQATYRRASSIFGSENTYLVTRKELKKGVLSQLPDVPLHHIIAEPRGRDTAPCIGFAATWLKKKRGDFPMLVLPSDHLIKNEKKFKRVVEAATKQAEKGFLVTIGIKPTRAETGYGYLQMGEKIEEVDGIPLLKLERFTEKPSQKKAKEFFEGGNFLWNAGIFAWKPSVILGEIAKYLPDLSQGLRKIEAALETDKERKVIEEVYPLLLKISIDYGVMEKTDKAVVIPGDFPWDDVGDWKVLERIFPKDEMGNIVKGLVKEKEVSNCTLINREDKMLGVIGISNLIVINSAKGTLVVSKELAGGVKDLVDELLQDLELRKYVE